MKWHLTSLVAVCLSLSIFPMEASTLYVDLNCTNPMPPYADLTNAATSIQDAVDAATNGDLILVNDGIYQDGYRATKQLGFASNDYDTNRVVIDKPVTVQSLNGPSAAFINGSGIYRCVYLTNGATLNGFTLTNGAAGWTETNGALITSIAADGGGVSGPFPGGVYSGRSFGAGAVSNCVLTSNSATGDGGGANGVILNHCTLTGNTSASLGGGAIAATLINCSLNGNHAVTGGGAASCTLLNCTITSNTTPVSGVIYLFLPPTDAGGGLYAGSAINCIIANNSAKVGGGVWGAVKLLNCSIVSNSASFYGGACPAGGSQAFNYYTYVTNCIIYFNSAGTNANYGPGNFYFDHTCTTPMSASGSGNITNKPTFVDFGNGDYHLAPDSPVINAGSNASMTNSTDLDGNPRIVGGTVDMGAYEFQSPSSALSYAWARQYGFPTDGSADGADPDGDGMNNWQEFIAGTNPTNASSFLAMSSAFPNKSLNWVVVKWQSVNTRTYYLERSADLSLPPTTSMIQSNLTGQTGTTIYIDTTATNGGPYFYRVGVQ